MGWGIKKVYILTNFAVVSIGLLFVSIVSKHNNSLF
jgi:hypothetical protein